MVFLEDLIQCIIASGAKHGGAEMEDERLRITMPLDAAGAGMNLISDSQEAGNPPNRLFSLERTYVHNCTKKTKSRFPAGTTTLGISESFTT